MTKTDSESVSSAKVKNKNKSIIVEVGLLKVAHAMSVDPLLYKYTYVFFALKCCSTRAQTGNDLKCGQENMSVT